MIATLVSVAFGGACCVGSTSTVPTRLGECEHVTAGISLTGEHAFATWDRAGKVRSHPTADQGLIASLGAGVRLNRELSVTADLPARLSRRGQGASSLGGGVGDVSINLTIDPLEEKAGGAAVPLFTLGLRAPTGRDWSESDNPKGADITGQGGVGLNAGVQLERTLDATPRTLGISASVPVGAQASLPSVTVTGSLGRYLSPRWSLIGGLRHTVSGFSKGRSHRTVASARIVHGRPLAYRFYGGVESDLPSPWVGRSNPLFARASIGAVWVH